MLADDHWLWGGSLDEIEYTIRHGIRNDQDEDARFSLMPTFGGEFALDVRDGRGVAGPGLVSGSRSADPRGASRGPGAAVIAVDTPVSPSLTVSWPDLMHG